MTRQGDRKKQINTKWVEVKVYLSSLASPFSPFRSLFILHGTSRLIEIYVCADHRLSVVVVFAGTRTGGVVAPSWKEACLWYPSY